MRILLAPHEYTTGATRRSRVQQAPGSLREPTASLVAPRPEVRRPSPLTRVSATLSPECQQPCHSGYVGGTDQIKEFQKHALTGENRVNGNEITLY